MSCLRFSRFYLFPAQHTMKWILLALGYLTTVGYGITVLGGHLLQKNKSMARNNRLWWKKSKNKKHMGWNNSVLGGNYLNNSEFL